MTAGTIIEWIKFRERGELLNGRKFLSNMKERIYRSRVRSVMLYGSETWCLRKNDIAALERTEKAMIKAMRGIKLTEKRSSEELMTLRWHCYGIE